MHENNADREVITRASGEACGSKIISIPGAMILDFIPIRFNSRMERALQNAILSVPGAKGIKNVTVEETWYYWLIGHTRCVIITGDVVR
ncbi:hypothetical protein [Leptospira langatensis]|nr:hypothetical protein [Leptospira langatensis]TGJ98967.1 hypothetical protein EHO57_15780 [Leptospira langatensis]